MMSLFRLIFCTIANMREEMVKSGLSCDDGMVSVPKTVGKWWFAKGLRQGKQAQMMPMYISITL